ncbi:MAG TPA: hypothetical protein DDY43_06020 [Synechococcales bacterium UBA10510]|nr:hypothetical protein [Synechococcales bacterium UBA10510]
MAKFSFYLRVGPKPISWNEVKSQALSFSKEWADETTENAEAKSFWDGFFYVFGISCKRVASLKKL